MSRFEAKRTTVVDTKNHCVIADTYASDNFGAENNADRIAAALNQREELKEALRAARTSGQLVALPNYERGELASRCLVAMIHPNRAYLPADFAQIAADAVAMADALIAGLAKVTP